MSISANTKPYNATLPLFTWARCLSPARRLIRLPTNLVLRVSSRLAIFARTWFDTIAGYGSGVMNARYQPQEMKAKQQNRVSWAFTLTSYLSNTNASCIRRTVPCVPRCAPHKVNFVVTLKFTTQTPD